MKTSCSSRLRNADFHLLTVATVTRGILINVGFVLRHGARAWLKLPALRVDWTDRNLLFLEPNPLGFPSSASVNSELRFYDPSGLQSPKARPPHRYMPVIGRASHCIAYWIQRQSHVKQILLQILRKRNKKKKKSKLKKWVFGMTPVKDLIQQRLRYSSSSEASKRPLEMPLPASCSQRPSPPPPPPPPPTLTVPAEREHPACDVCACFFFFLLPEISRGAGAEASPPQTKLPASC